MQCAYTIFGSGTYGRHLNPNPGQVQLSSWRNRPTENSLKTALVGPKYPSVSLSLQITNAPLDMHHVTCGINPLLHSVNLVVFTLLVHLILRISPHHSHHLRSHHLSLPRPFTPDLKLISFTNLSSIVTLVPSGLPSRILTCTVLKGHWRCLF